jgi:flagellar biosynthesis/type III secretory pathway protein FliH
LQNSVRDFEQQGIDKKLATVQQFLQDLETRKDTNMKSIQEFNTQIDNINSELAKQQVIYVIRNL